jgi:hypothetical protein
MIGIAVGVVGGIATGTTTGGAGAGDRGGGVDRLALPLSHPEANTASTAANATATKQHFIEARVDSGAGGKSCI